MEEGRPRRHHTRSSSHRQLPKREEDSSASTKPPASEEGLTSTKACLSCQTAKVKCDRALPSCARCVKRGVICRQDQEQPIDVWIDPRHPFQLQLAVLRQIVEPATHFKVLSNMFIDAVKDMHQRGAINRIRAISTLRFWGLQSDGHRGFDVSWGACPAIMSLLGITDEEVSKDQPVPIAFPDVGGGLPLMGLVEGADKMDFSTTAACRALDPTKPTTMSVAPGADILWMNKLAVKRMYPKGVINLVMKVQKCTGFHLLGLSAAPSDRGELMRLWAEFMFGTRMSETAMTMMINKKGMPLLHMVSLRWRAVSEYGGVCICLSFEEMPPSRHLMKGPIRRSNVLDSFRQQHEEAEAAGGGGKGEGGKEEDDEEEEEEEEVVEEEEGGRASLLPSLSSLSAMASAAAGGGPASAPSSPSPIAALSEAVVYLHPKEGGGEAGEDDDDEDEEDNEGVTTLPMTTIGQSFNWQKAVGRWKGKRRRSDQTPSWFHTLTASIGKGGGGRKGGKRGTAPPPAGGGGGGGGGKGGGGRRGRDGLVAVAGPEKGREDDGDGDDDNSGVDDNGDVQEKEGRFVGEVPLHQPPAVQPGKGDDSRKGEQQQVEDYVDAVWGRGFM